MGKFKGTKGSWHVVTGTESNGNGVYSVDSNGWNVCAVWSVENGDNSDATANAQLIATAPELLDALWSARAVMLAKRDMSGLSNKETEILAKAESAINKALGHPTR